MENKTIRVYRHAYSEHNAGTSNDRDNKLHADGIKQCNYLTGNYDLVICSTLRRTKQTLQYSNIEYKNLLLSEDIREVKDGNPDNYLIYEEIKKESNDEYIIRLKRFNSMVVDMLKIYDSICVITHGCVLQKLTGYWFKNAYWMDYDLDGWKRIINKLK